METSLLAGVTDCQSLGARVRMLRTEKNMSVAELARRARLSESTIRNIEAGDANPLLNTLVGVAYGLGICEETFGFVPAYDDELQS